MSWVWKQGNASQNSGTASSLPFTTQNNTVNALLICGIGYYVNTSNTPTGDLSFSDSKGNTWTKAYSIWYQVGPNPYWQYQAIYYAVNTNGTGGEKITVDISGYYSGASATNLAIEEFTGNALSSLVDGTGNYSMQGYASGAQVLNLPSLTTSANGDLIYAFVYDYEWLITAFTSQGIWTVQEALYNKSTYPPMCDEWGVQTTGGLITPTLGLTSSAAHSTYGILTTDVAFKAAAGGGMNQVQEAAWWRNPYLQ
jgi:hypothetical protein